MKTIYFYSRSTKFFELSNFSHHPIVVEGLIYTTNEHYFQSVKFTHEATFHDLINDTYLPYREVVRLAKTPADAKRLGSSRKYPIHSDWDVRRIDVMRTAIREKFTQHPKLKKLLLSTGDAMLVEDSPTDTFWGCGRNRNGENWLGKLLMELRTSFQNEKAGV